MHGTQISFLAKKMQDSKHIPGSNGNQFLLAALKHQDTHYAVIYDKITNSIYIEKLKTTLIIEPYSSSNFMKIEDDEEWNAVNNILKEHGINI